MFKYYFQLIQQQLKTITELKEVEWYLGQFDQTGDQVLFATPSAFIEFNTLPMEQLGSKVQKATISFTVYLVNESLFDDSKRVTDDTTNHLGLMGDIYKALSHYNAYLSDLPANSNLKGTADDMVVVNSLTRTSVQFIHEISNLLISVQTFQGSFVDTTASPQFQKVQAALNLNVTNV